MKERARELVTEVFNEWCDAIEADNKSLKEMYYNRFMGAVELYAQLFGGYVSYRAKTRKITFEER